MNRKNRSILYALSLGDGSLVNQKKKANGQWSTCKLQLSHGPKQLPYLEWKADVIHSIFGGERPNIHKVTFTLSNGKTYDRYCIGKSNKYFKAMRRKLYPWGKKTYTKWVMDQITEQGLAIWFMDDGHLRGRKNKQGDVSSLEMQISTCTSKEEVDLLQDWFKERFDIELKVYQTKSGWNLAGNTLACRKLVSIIKNHIPVECMQYKIQPALDFVFYKSARHPDFNKNGVMI